MDSQQHQAWVKAFAFANSALVRRPITSHDSELHAAERSNFDGPIAVVLPLVAGCFEEPSFLLAEVIAGERLLNVDGGGECLNSIGGLFELGFVFEEVVGCSEMWRLVTQGLELFEGLIPLVVELIKVLIAFESSMLGGMD